MTAENSFSHSEPVGILGTNGHEPLLGLEGRHVMPSSTRSRGNDHEGQERLLEAISQLVDGLRDMTSSWAVERSDLIKDVRLIKDKMVDLELMKAKVDDIDEFIKGGDDGHLGERMAIHEHKIKTLESEHHNRQKERSRTFWTVISLIATVFAGIAVEAVKIALEYNKH